jgi:hypothetical protein
MSPTSHSLILTRLGADKTNKVMQQMSKDVEEVKCMYSPTRIPSVETEFSAQGRRYNKTFTNGFLRQTRPQITTLRARPTKREQPRGSFKARNSSTGCQSVLYCGFMENISLGSAYLLLLKT